MFVNVILILSFVCNMDKREGKENMFNLIKDEFDENSEDILESIHKMLANKKEEKEEEKNNK